jgi:hypothetical protein
MGITTVNSPWNTTGNEPMRGYSPGSRSSPSNAARSDGGHLAGHLGKSASQPASASRDAVRVQGGESAAPLQQALDKGMRGDRR